MEDFVTFDIAKKLKEKGFDCKTRYGYLPPMPSLLEAFCDTNWSAKNGYSAPTISQVLKWLREENNIHISIMLFMFQEGWCFEIIQTGKNPKLITTQRNSCKTYEEAALAGIQYVIDNLI